MRLDAVTGAFSYSGASITRELRARGRRVRTLTGHPERAPAETDVEVAPLDFADPAGLEESLGGVDTLYNTYWVRFPHGPVDHARAVGNSDVLFAAARRAGVRRIVHVSILHPQSDSPYPYFRGKARVEDHLAGLGVEYAIARPAVLFGRDGVLVNNIAWLLRHLPVFAIGGRGQYRIRPVHVDDLAHACVDLGLDAPSGTVIDAVGPESWAFRDLVDTVRSAVGSRALFVPAPGAVVPALAAALSLVLRDRLLTAEEYHAMAAGLADSTAPTAGPTRFSDWLTQHADQLGRRYINDLASHYHHAPA